MTKTISLIVLLLLVAMSSANAQKLYVTGEFSDTITILDATTYEVAGIIPQLNDPVFPTLNHAETKVYVPQWGADAVLVIDPVSDGVIDTIPVGSHPNSIAITADDQWGYVTDQMGNTVSVIDLAAGTLLTSIPVGEYPTRLAVSPNGLNVYVTNMFGENIYIIDVATNTVTDSIAMPACPRDIDFSPDGSKAYVTLVCTSEEIAVIDCATNSISALISISDQSWDQLITAGGSRIVATLPEDDAVEMIDALADTVVQTIPVGDTPHYVALSGSGEGSLVYVLNTGSNSISVIDVETSAVTATIPSPPYPWGLLYLSQPVGLAELPGSPVVSVYPNPSHGTFRIEGIAGLLEAVVTDASGKTIAAAIVQEENGLVVTVNGVPGVYLLSLRSENTLVTLRLIKE